jgi:hypothetical protein
MYFGIRRQVFAKKPERKDSHASIAAAVYDYYHG